MDSKSKEKLTMVHPELAKRVEAVIEDLGLQGIEARVVQGLRTYAAQDVLFAQGRTTPGEIVTQARGGHSNHNFGLAVDLAIFKNGKVDWDDIPSYQAIGAAGKKQGLHWGGQFKKFIDLPHLELPGPTIATCRHLFETGGLPAVWKAANAANNIHTLPGITVPPSPFPATQPPQPELKIGATGDAVRRLQLALRSHGELVDVDWTFGPATEKAVKSFQLRKHLRPDGIAGPNTNKALGLG